MKRATTTSKEAQRLGLLFFKSRSNGTYCLCRELKNYDYNDNPLGLKLIFANAKLKAVKGFLAELAKKKERKEWQKQIKDGVAKRALHLESVKLKPANNEPSLFDGFVS